MYSDGGVCGRDGNLRSGRLRGVDQGAEAVGASDGERAIADGKTDALGGTRAGVAGGEHTGNGRLQRAGFTMVQRPLPGIFPSGTFSCRFDV